MEIKYSKEDLKKIKEEKKAGEKEFQEAMEIINKLKS